MPLTAIDFLQSADICPAIISLPVLAFRLSWLLPGKWKSATIGSLTAGMLTQFYGDHRYGGSNRG